MQKNCKSEEKRRTTNLLNNQVHVILKCKQGSASSIDEKNERNEKEILNFITKHNMNTSTRQVQSRLICVPYSVNLFWVKIYFKLRVHCIFNNSATTVMFSQKLQYPEVYCEDVADKIYFYFLYV